MTITTNLLKKEIGVKPTELLKQEGRQEAMRRLWNTSEPEIMPHDKEGNRYVNFYQVWNQHPVWFVAGAIAAGLIIFRSIYSRFSS